MARMSTSHTVRPYDFKRLSNYKDTSELLLTHIAYVIARYKENASYYFQGIRFYKWSTIILAGISTIVLGLDLGDYSNSSVVTKMKYTVLAKNIALVIGAIITVSTALVSYWNIEKYWLTNKTIANKLEALQEDIEHDIVAGTLTNDKE